VSWPQQAIVDRAGAAQPNDGEHRRGRRQRLARNGATLPPECMSDALEIQAPRRSEGPRRRPPDVLGLGAGAGDANGCRRAGEVDVSAARDGGGAAPRLGRQAMPRGADRRCELVTPRPSPSSSRWIWLWWGRVRRCVPRPVQHLLERAMAAEWSRRRCAGNMFVWARTPVGSLRITRRMTVLGVIAQDPVLLRGRRRGVSGATYS